MRMEWRRLDCDITRGFLRSTMCSLEIQANLVGMVYTKPKLKFESKDSLLVAFSAKWTPNPKSFACLDSGLSIPIVG